MVPLPHAASTDISVRQLQALVTPWMQIADDLVDAWIWWFNFNQPNQGGVWVPQLGWAHMLIAPPAEPRPTPSTGGQEQAAPQPRANALNIPPYNGLAYCQSRIAPDRGRNLRDMVERYPPREGTPRAGPPRREDDPRKVATTTRCGSPRTRRSATGTWKPSTPSSKRAQPCQTAPPPCPKTSPQTP